MVALALAPTRRVISTIDINATPAQVWAVLSETPEYPQGNPEISALIGPLVPGATLEKHEGTGSDDMVFHPTVLVVRPAEELRWRGKLWVRGLFDAEHFFLMAPHGGGTSFTQGERCHGIFLWFFPPDAHVLGFDGMNRALKARLERGA